MGGRGAASGASKLSLSDGTAKSSASKFKTASEMGLPSAKTWNKTDFPIAPSLISAKRAHAMLESSFSVHDKFGNEVIFDRGVIRHWQEGELKSGQTKNIPGRLQHLPLAIDTVKNSRELWEQKGQRSYIKAFRYANGKTIGCKVFVGKNGITISYFPNKVNGLETARKGYSLKK